MSKFLKFKKETARELEMGYQTNVRKAAWVAAGMLLTTTAGTAIASPLTVTNDFVADTPATAASVNQNFSDVENSVNDNDARTTTNTGNIDTNTTDIGSNTAAIGTNTSDIADNFSLITGNTADIANNFNALDQRLIPLESGFNGMDIPVDCSVATGSPDALLNTSLVPGNTYVIEGFCDGPISITEPAGRYRFRGLNDDKTLDGISSPVSETAYYVFDAYGPISASFNHLTISGANYTSQTDGVWVGTIYAEGGAAVYIQNTNVEGGDGGIFADSASAIIGPGVSVTGFGQTGLGAINNAFILSTSGSGTVTVEGANGLNGGTAGYREAISAFRGGAIRLNSGGTFSGGTDDGSNPNFASYAANSGETGALRIQNGTVTMTGIVEAGSNGSLRIDGSGGIDDRIDGFVSAFHGGHVRIQAMTINGFVDASYGSSIDVRNGVINGRVDGYSSSTIIVRDSDQSGGNVSSSQSSLVRFDGASTVDTSGFFFGAQFGAGIDIRDTTTVTADGPIDLTLNATLSLRDSVDLGNSGINCQSQTNQVSIGGSVANVGSLAGCL